MNPYWSKYSAIPDTNHVKKKGCEMVTAFFSHQVIPFIYDAIFSTHHSIAL